MELELLDELELEFDELLDDELELELLDELELEFDELLPATMIEPSLRLAIAIGGRSTSEAAGYSLACAAVLASAAIPATSADLSFHCLVIVTPFSDRTGTCGPAEQSKRPQRRICALQSSYPRLSMAENGINRPRIPDPVNDLFAVILQRKWISFRLPLHEIDEDGEKEGTKSWF